VPSLSAEDESLPAHGASGACPTDPADTIMEHDGKRACGLVTVRDTTTVIGTQVSIIAADVREPSPGSELAPWEWVLSE
jgi:hypothetical protein